MKNKLKNKAFIISAIPWFIVGIIFGVVVTYLPYIKMNINVNYILNIVSCVLLGISIIFWILGIVVAVKANKDSKNNDDEEHLEKTEKNLDISVIFCTISVLAIFLATGLLSYGFDFQKVTITETVFTFIFVTICLSTSYIQYKIINIKKRINPEKRGNPLKLSFNKEWYNSCDEAQKRMVGEIAYKTYSITSTIFMFMFVAIIIVVRYVDIGIFSVILIALINIINITVYNVFSIKIQYKNIK